MKNLSLHWLVLISMSFGASLPLAAAPIPADESQIRKLVSSLIHPPEDVRPYEIYEGMKKLNRGPSALVLGRSLLEALKAHPYSEYVLRAAARIGANKVIHEGLQTYEKQYFSRLMDYYKKNRVYPYQKAIINSAPDEATRTKYIEEKLNSVPFTAENHHHIVVWLHGLREIPTAESLNLLLKIATNKKLEGDSLQYREGALDAISRMFKFADRPRVQKLVVHSKELKAALQKLKEEKLFEEDVFMIEEELDNLEQE